MYAMIKLYIFCCYIKYIFSHCVLYAFDVISFFLALFIVNAPKSAPASYINYYDITYSQTGPRSPQVFLIHILQW